MNEIELDRGTFRVRGDVIDIRPAESEWEAVRVEFFDEQVESIRYFDPLTGEYLQKVERVSIYPKTHYATPKSVIHNAIDAIKIELKERLAELEKANKLVEAQRLQQRTTFDIEMMVELGYCSGIENYSRYLSGRQAGEHPPTLYDYLPANALLFIDESHVTIGQLNGMYRGDRARKETLVEYGFRLPSALDNRPLRFDEFERMAPQTIYVSATPGDYELQHSGQIAEQIVRPTGLLDPLVEVLPAINQVDDLQSQINATVAKGERVLVTTLTKKMAENLSDYLDEHGIRVRYMHSDIDTVERTEIIRDLRLGVFDVLVGINLLREGLDSETERRRQKQMQYNKAHGITPQSISKAVGEMMVGARFDMKKVRSKRKVSVEPMSFNDAMAQIEDLEKQMKIHAQHLEFEAAAAIRDQIEAIRDSAI